MKSYHSSRLLTNAFLENIKASPGYSASPCWPLTCARRFRPVASRYYFVNRTDKVCRLTAATRASSAVPMIRPACT